MTTVLNPPEQATQKVILHDVSWAFYERLLAEYEGASNPRFAYDRGVLEIMVSGFEHENLKHDFATLVEIIAAEIEVDIVGAGSTTFRREYLHRGFEPDASFYIQNAERVRGKKRLDLNEDPPPDLVIEIDITHPSLDKFPIFSGLGVSEVWRYDGKNLFFYKLEDEGYTEQSESAALPGVTAERVAAFITESQQIKRADWLRNVREWARSLKA